MRLLDLFCGAGGCSVGYQRAGFDVVGVDIEPHPDYPFTFIQGDAMDVLADRAFLDTFDVVHASPPCPRYSAVTPAAARMDHPDLVGPVREALRSWGGVYVIENVPGAPLDHPALLCGGSFGLGTRCRDGVYRALRRHRLFESNVFLMSAGCGCDGHEKIGVYGNGGGGSQTRGYKGHIEDSRRAMGINWMRTSDLCDAIPPAYTHYLGEQLVEALAQGVA